MLNSFIVYRICDYDSPNYPPIYAFTPNSKFQHTKEIHYLIKKSTIIDFYLIAFTLNVSTQFWN